MKILILTSVLFFVACSTTAVKDSVKTDSAEQKEDKAPLAFEYSSSRR